MPKTKTVRVITEDKPVTVKEIEKIIEGADDERTPEDIEAAEKLQQFQESYGDKNYRIRVEKFNRDEADFEIVPEKFKLDGFDPILQLRRYGPGRYRLTLLDDKGKYVPGGRSEIKIAAAIEPEVQERERPRSALEDPVVRVLIENMQATQNQATELLKSFITKPAEAPKAPAMTELIQALSQLKGLAPQEENGLKRFKELAEIMTLVKGLAPESEPQSEGLMSDILQALKIVKESGALHRVAPHAPVTQVPRKIERENPSVTAKLEPSPIADAVRKYVPVFEGWAKRDYDVQLASDFLVDVLTDEIAPLIAANYRPGGISLTPEYVVQNLVDRTQDSAEVEKIYGFAPELSAYREWVGKVIAKAVNDLTTPTAEDDEKSLAN